MPDADVLDGEKSEAVFVLLDEMLSLLKVEEQEEGDQGMVRAIARPANIHSSRISHLVPLALPARGQRDGLRKCFFPVATSPPRPVPYHPPSLLLSTCSMHMSL